MNRTLFLFLCALLSIYWAILLATGYSRSTSEMPVSGPAWTRDLVWTVYLRKEGGYREFTLPAEFQARAAKGDRVESVSHAVEFLGLNFFASEAFLWRRDETRAAWRQHRIPSLLLMLLGALAPLLVGAIVVGSIWWVRRDAGLDRIALRFLFGSAAVVVLIVVWRVDVHPESDAVLVQRAAERFKAAATFDAHPEGAWTGDVTELFRLGAIRREIAEADAAPLRPLVPKPKPYHGYYFIAMETGPSDSDDGVPLKPGPRNRESYAFCAFPAKEGPDQRVWLVCPTGFFGRRMDGGKPVLRWPSPTELRSHWGRYCRVEGPVRSMLASVR